MCDSPVEEMMGMWAVGSGWVSLHIKGTLAGKCFTVSRN